MPYVNVKVTPEGLTAERKRRIIAGITQLLVEVLGKDPARTMVVIHELDAENWGLGGHAVSADGARGSR